MITENEKDKIEVKISSKYYNVNQVSDITGLSIPQCYRIIKSLNEELKSKGFMTIDGRVPIRYCVERLHL